MGVSAHVHRRCDPRRYAEVLPDERADTTTGFLQRAIALFRDHDVQVEPVMTDNASWYYAHRFNRELEGGILETCGWPPSRGLRWWA